MNKPVINPGKYAITKSQVKTKFDIANIYAQDFSSSNDVTNFNNIYKIKVDLPNGKQHQTWVSYTALINSCFHDNLELFLSEDGSRITGIHYHPAAPKKTCDPSKLSQKDKVSPNFVTTIRVIPHITSSGVDSERWLHEYEQDQAKKVQEKEQPQSFFGKYWMYIAAGVFIMSAMGG